MRMPRPHEAERISFPLRGNLETQVRCDRRINLVKIEE